MPTRSEVARWKPFVLADMATSLQTGDGEYTGELGKMRGGIQAAGQHWHGLAYDAAYDRIGTDCDTALKVSQATQDLVLAMRQGAQTVQSHLDVLNNKVRDAEGDKCDVSDDWVVTGDEAKVPQHVAAIGTALTELTNAAKDTAIKIRDCATDIRACGDRLPEGLDPSGRDHVISEQESRDEASAEAFHKQFGRYPSSASDWTTASILNPNSYLDKYVGLPPDIKVARIDTVPGQGVVRTSSFIEQYSVFNRPFYDLGDNRPNSPDFDVENSRVSTYIDYENGIVVMRQNPSVDTNGHARVGSPDAEVWQNSDGSVRLKYEATNPYNPGLIGPIHAPSATVPTVHGDVVITPGHGDAGTPGSTGVTINGTRADYPSFEVYQDSPAGDTHTVVVDPAESGESWGPLMNLWTDHDIGSGSRALEPYQYIQEYGGRIPPTLQDSPGGVQLGSGDNPPRVRRQDY